MTVVRPSLPSGYTIFCDDIRHEMLGKKTIVGTYQSVMYINGSLPITLAKFCMMIVLWEEIDSVEPVTLKVFLPGEDDDHPTGTFNIQPQPDMLGEAPIDEFTMRESRFYLELPGVAIKEEGRFRVRAYLGDKEIRLGSLNVSVNPLETSENAQGVVQSD